MHPTPYIAGPPDPRTRLRITLRIVVNSAVKMPIPMAAENTGSWRITTPVYVVIIVSDTHEDVAFIRRIPTFCHDANRENATPWT